MYEKLINSVRGLLSESEIDALTDAVMQPPIRALRINPLKISVEEFLHLCPMPLEKNPFSDEGLIYDGEIFLAGLSPFHHAGLYYILDPSAFVAIEYLRPYLGKRVLDLCAAPGGKASFCASLLDDDGFIVANDVEYTRAKILSQNFERLGITNSLITSNSPAFFEQNYPEYFDTIIVDAPCTGENIAKNSNPLLFNYGERSSGVYFVRQSQLLQSAAAALCIGGHLLYTTSSINTTENEEVINHFLATHDFEIVPVPEKLKESVRSGFGIEAARVFPHDGGEGHFSCVLKKLSGEGDYPPPDTICFDLPSDETVAEAVRMLNELSNRDYGALYIRDDNLFAFMDNLPIVKGLNVLRAGLKIAKLTENGIIPSHSLAMTLAAADSKKNMDFTFPSEEIRHYLAGNPVNAEPSFEGYGTISLSGHCTGLIKCEEGKIINCYPKGLRFFTK